LVGCGTACSATLCAYCHPLPDTEDGAAEAREDAMSGSPTFRSLRNLAEREGSLDTAQCSTRRHLLIPAVGS